MIAMRAPSAAKPQPPPGAGALPSPPQPHSSGQLRNPQPPTAVRAQPILPSMQMRHPARRRPVLAGQTDSPHNNRCQLPDQLVLIPIMLTPRQTPLLAQTDDETVAAPACLHPALDALEHRSKTSAHTESSLHRSRPRATLLRGGPN
jgi:hypothetical protein